MHQKVSTSIYNDSITDHKMSTGPLASQREQDSRNSLNNDGGYMADPGPPAHGTDALTQEQFHGLLQRLHHDRDQAAREYGKLHWKLVKFFRWSSCSLAEELADETLNRAARKLHAGDHEIPNLEAFVWGIAKRIRQEGRKKDLRTLGLADMPGESVTSDAGATVDAIDGKIQLQQELRYLRDCLSRLSPEDQELFLAYRVDKGHYLEARTKLAERFGLSPGALRVRIIRLREKLEKCVAKRLGRYTVIARSEPRPIAE
jgi:RNA polymerase sigma factor (sigma-70 family)